MILHFSVPLFHCKTIPVYSSSLRPGSNSFTGEINLLVIFLKV